MDMLLEGICFTIRAYLNEAEMRKYHLKRLIEDTSNAEHEIDILKTYKDALERLEKEISVLSDLYYEIQFKFKRR